MLEFAKNFSFPLQQTASRRQAQFQSQQLMERRLERERGLAKLQERLRTAKNAQNVFQVATLDTRKLLDSERAAIYQFNPDYSGRFIAESATPGWSDLVKIIPFIQDTFLQRTKGGRYKDGECLAVNDIYTRWTSNLSRPTVRTDGSPSLYHRPNLWCQSQIVGTDCRLSKLCSTSVAGR